MAPKPNQFVDDLEDLKPTTAATAPAPAPTSPIPAQSGPTPAPAPAPTQPTRTASAEDDEEDAPAPGTKAPAAKQTSDDYDVSFGDEKLMSRSDGLDILRPEKGKTVRFALLSNYLKAKRAFVHYIEKKGTYHCLDSEKNGQVCCTKLGNSQPQIVVLVLHYTNVNPKTGRYDKDANGQYPPIQWEIKFVRLSRSAFRRISSLAEEDSTPEAIDIIMSHRDSGIGYEYSKISTARWKKNPELVKEVEAAIQPFAADNGKKLLAKLGKKISLLEFRAVLAGAGTQTDEADLSQVDDI